MNRRRFLSFLGIGAATAVVAPKVLASMPTQKDFYTSLDGKLSVFEKAREGYDYSIGVETGDGFSTPSVFSVMRIGNDNEPCAQVAEYVSRDRNVTQFSYDIAKVAGMYRAFCKDPRGPMLVIEQVSAPGDCTQVQLKIMGLTRFYTLPYKYLKKDRNGDYREVETLKTGWYSSKFSGKLMMDRFNDALKEGWYKPNSKMLSASQVRAAALSYIAAQKPIDRQ